MKNILLLACLSCPLIATAIGFEVVPMPAGFSSITDLNRQGDYVGFSPEGVRANIGGNIVTLPSVTPNGTSVSVFGGLKVSENGWLYGFSGNYGGFNSYYGIVARPGEGWRQTQLSQAAVVGVTGQGKAFIRIGPSGSDTVWWDPATNTYVAGAFRGFAKACNLAGDAIYDYNGWFGRAGQPPFQLQYQGWFVWSENLNEEGDVAGAADNLSNGGTNSAGVVWDRHGNIVLSIPTPVGATSKTYFYDINNRRQVVGLRAAGPTSSEATYYSAETGLVSINANLTPTSIGYSFSSAIRISDNGFIRAFGRGPGETSGRYYLLRVVPEPASMAALGMGLLGVLRSRRSGRKNPKTSC